MALATRLETAMLRITLKEGPGLPHLLGVGYIAWLNPEVFC